MLRIQSQTISSLMVGHSLRLNGVSLIQHRPFGNVQSSCSSGCCAVMSAYQMRLCIIYNRVSGYRRVEVVVSYKMDSTANQCPMPRKVLECSIAMRTGGPYRMRYTVHHTARRLAECNGPSLSATRARARPIALSGPCSSPAHESMQVRC